MAVVVAIVAAFENWQVEVVEVAHCYQYCNWVPWIAMKFEEVEFETAVVVETVETNKDLLFVVTKVAKRQIFKRLKKWTYFQRDDADIYIKLMCIITSINTFFS